VTLWIETAYQGLARSGEEVCGEAVRTFQTEDCFCAVLASAPGGGEEGYAHGCCLFAAAAVAERALEMLQAGGTSGDVARALVGDQASLPTSGRGDVAFSILQVLGGDRAHLVECETLPLCLIRDGEVAFLPLSEEVFHGRLLRECRFRLQDGDYIVMVSQGYLRPRGWGWSWTDIAVAVRRWTDTGCDADELLGALMRTYRRLNPEVPRHDVTVVVMHVRPEHRATVWTGPPADPAQDEAALATLMAAPGARIICGGTTAQIAARLLGTELVLEDRPEDGWAEVPPVSRLEEVDLVTEGLVTLSKARERLAGARRARDLPRGEDGATRLARALLAADRVHFVVGLAVNPAQTAGDAGNIPLRRTLVGEVAHNLRAYGKIVSVQYL
jgi:hypothetical protein